MRDARYGILVPSCDAFSRSWLSAVGSELSVFQLSFQLLVSFVLALPSVLPPFFGDEAAGGQPHHQCTVSSRLARFRHTWSRSSETRITVPIRFARVLNSRCRRVRRTNSATSSSSTSR